MRACNAAHLKKMCLADLSNSLRLKHYLDGIEKLQALSCSRAYSVHILTLCIGTFHHTFQPLALSLAISNTLLLLLQGCLLLLLLLLQLLIALSCPISCLPQCLQQVLQTSAGSAGYLVLRRFWCSDLLKPCMPQYVSHA